MKSFMLSFLCALFLLYPNISQGQITIGTDNQKNDNTKKKEKKETHISKIDPFRATTQDVEGSGLVYDSLQWNLEGIQNYNPLYENHINFQSLGDVGMPYQLHTINKVGKTGFNHGWNLYDEYLYNHKNTPYLRTFNPFTRLQYAQTKKEYIHLQGLHTQNITPGWNVALRFQTINNIGFYPRQKNSLRQFGFSSRYMDLSNRYYAQVNLNYNRMRMEENGGWADEANFDSLRGTNKSAEVNLNNSSNYFGDREYTLEQVYWFSGTYEKTSDTTKYFKPILGIKHQSIFAKTFNVFDSEGEDLFRFPAIYIDSAKTHDSSAFAQQTHSIGITKYLTDSTRFYFYAGAGVDILKVHYLNFGKIKPGNNLFTHLNIKWQPINNLILNVKGKNYIAGYNIGDLLWEGKLAYSFFNTKKYSSQKRLPLEQFSGRIISQNKTPEYIKHYYFSNHANWLNQFKKEKILFIEGGLSGHLVTGDWGIKITNTVIANPTYMDENITPSQYNGIANQTEFHILKNLKLKKFHLNNQLVFQIAGNKTTSKILPTPKISTYNSLFYQDELFKKALKMQIGVDFRWYSEFFANAYDPITRLFYLQNRRMQGNYPIIDIFAATEVKTFRLFAKLEHSNFELLDNSFQNLYYSTPGYSLPPLRFSFGINWKFYE